MASTLTDSGLAAIAQSLGGEDGANTMAFVQVGNGALVVSESTTELDGPLTPMVASINTATGSVLRVDGFFTNSQVNDDLTEWGIWNDTQDELLACGTIEPTEEKTAAFTLTLSIAITFANA